VFVSLGKEKGTMQNVVTRVINQWNVVLSQEFLYGEC